MPIGIQQSCVSFAGKHTSAEMKPSPQKLQVITSLLFQFGSKLNFEQFGSKLLSTCLDGAVASPRRPPKQHELAVTGLPYPPQANESRYVLHILCTLA